MAQKRMFDRAIIETDNFLNVSMSAKALYFLLGMEADDEGFVSPNRVLRLYGGEMGDIKNLIDTGLVIPFESGVIVITHWQENNWLDSRRIKPTQYQKEKGQLSLTTSKTYVLSSRSASIEESRGEQKRIDNTSNFQLPDWLNKQVWSEWEQYRKELKKKLTPTSVKKQLDFLFKNRENHVKIINQSIKNGWTGLFELKNTNLTSSSDAVRMVEKIKQEKEERRHRDEVAANNESYRNIDNMMKKLANDKKM